MHTTTRLAPDHTTRTPGPLAGHPYRAPRLRALSRVELPSAARAAWLATRSALAAVLLSFAVAFAASGCGGTDGGTGGTPDTDPPVELDAAVVDGAIPDAPRADTTGDAPRADASVDAARDATTDAGSPALDVPEDRRPEDVLRVDAGTSLGTDAPAAVDTGVPDSGGADAGPPRRPCSTGADCPAFSTWTCGAARVCQCNPGPAGAVAGCGTRDNDCDGVADPEEVCPSTAGNVCVDTRTNPRHCGGCGRSCPGRQLCEGGACACTAPGLQLLCNAVCVDMSAPTGPASEWCTFCNTYCAPSAVAADPARTVCCRGACYPTPPGSTPAGPIYACVTRPRR